MSSRQIYASVNDLVDALEHGFHRSKQHLRFLRAASQKIANESAYGFLPVIESRKFYGNNGDMISIGACLQVTSVQMEWNVESETWTETLDADDYELLPLNGMWTNGPKTVLHYKSGYFGENDAISVTGIWGLYDETETISDESITQDASQTSITVEDGAKISEGMVLQVEDEYEFVTARGAATTASSLTDGAFAIGDNTLSVDDGSEFHEGEVLLIETELMKITLINGDDLAVIRGWEESIISEHADNSTIKVYRTYTVERGVNGSSAAAHAAKAVAQVKVPDDVNYLAVQIAALMFKKAQTGFTGQVGTSYSGGAQYLNEFPPRIEDVLINYSILGI